MFCNIYCLPKITVLMTRPFLPEKNLIHKHMSPNLRILLIFIYFTMIKMQEQFIKDLHQCQRDWDVFCIWKTNLSNMVATNYLTWQHQGSNSRCPGDRPKHKPLSQPDSSTAILNHIFLFIPYRSHLSPAYPSAQSRQINASGSLKLGDRAQVVAKLLLGSVRGQAQGLQSSGVPRVGSP